MHLRPAERRLPLEERWNAITHGIAAGLSLIALVAIVVFGTIAGEPLRLVAAMVFGLSLCVLYAASTCYHACRVGPRKRMLRVVDHAAIYVVIAATYTAVLPVLMPGTFTYALVAGLWIAAGFGVASKIQNVERSPLWSTLLYVAMGWAGLLVIKPMFETLPGGCLAWILAGGVAYTAGVIFYLWERLRFGHAVWHVFVTAGSVCHCVAVLWYVVPMPG